jgi:hypothetical protein
MSRIRTAVAALTVVAAFLAATAAPAAAAPTRSDRLTPLPGCAQTWAPKVGDQEHRVCLRKMPERVSASKASSCTLEIYQHGPYGSREWERGWVVAFCWYGNEAVPIDQNDDASSWRSFCSPGIFYVHQPDVHPMAAYPENATGDFPWGAVPNDSLSSVWMRQNCP